MEISLYGMAILMKKVQRKEHLKKLMYVQHIIIWAFIGLGVILIITKTSARDAIGLNDRDTKNYINDTFREANPTTGDVFDALYSGQTAYTKYMNWYTNSCQKENINFIEITGNNEDIQVIPQLITSNTIYILSWWKYAVINKTTLSWDCIAIIGRWNVEFLGMIDFTNTKYSIIDNISYHNNRISLPEYTTTTGINIYIENSSVSGFNFIITWDNTQELNWYLGWTDNDIYTIEINSNDSNTIHGIFYDTYNILNHTKKTVTHDNILPIITWTKVGTTTTIQNNWLYNTGIRIQIFDTNLSGIFNEALFLSGWITNYDNTFPIEGIYNIIAKDKAWNQTGISFEIDTTPPSITNLQPASWSTYTNTSLRLSRQVNENTTRIESQKYYLYNTGNSIITSWTVVPGNTWITLINIDKWSYNRKIVIKDIAWNTSTGSIPFFTFNKLNSIFTGTTAYILGNTWYTNNDPTILFSWNKRFEWKIYTGTTWSTYFYKSGNNTNIWSTISETIARQGWNTGTIKITLGYKTEDNESWTGIFNFYIDKTVPSLWLSPLGWRRNSTGNIVYTRSWLNKLSWMIKYYTFSMNNNIVYSWTNTTYTQTGIQVNNQYRAQVCAYDIAGNVGCSPVQTIVIDQTPPQIHNIVNSWFYKNIPNPAPIIVDESWEALYNVILRRNGIIVLQTWSQPSPYVINLQWWEALYQITANDEAGNSTQVNFTIDTTLPTINLISPLSWTIITWGNSMIFSWTGQDGYFSWYEFVLSGNSYGPYYTWFTTTNSNRTIANLNNGEYQRWVTIFDKAGNKTKSPVYPLKINVPLTGEIKIWWIGVTTVSYITYSRTWTVQLQTNINKPTIAEITWDIVSQYWYNMINQLIPAWNQITFIDLTPGEWQKKIYISLKDWDPQQPQEIAMVKYITVDTTWPSKPNITSINNQIYTGTINLDWPDSTDNWAWVKEYNYIIQQGTTTKKSGTWSTSAILIQNMELWLAGTFTIKVQAIDHIGNQSERSESAMFTYTGIPDTSPELFTFSRQDNAKRNTLYKSNTITITWLSTYTFIKASIDEWNLFVNGSHVNKESLVTNWDIIYIELESSDDYYSATTSTLTINDKAAIFKIITEKDGNEEYEDDDDELSNKEIEELKNVYSLVSILDDNLKLKFKEMLEEKIDELEEDWENPKEIAKLRYIYDRLVKDINNTTDIIYKAPNGKEYIIVYKEWLWYSSINFSASNQSKYFSTLDSIKEFINKNNGGSSSNYTIDKSWNTAPYKAPNWKIYNFFKTTTWKYGSYNMVVPKLFNTLQELKTHIDKNNPKK